MPSVLKRSDKPASLGPALDDSRRSHSVEPFRAQQAALRNILIRLDEGKLTADEAAGAFQNYERQYKTLFDRILGSLLR